MNSSLESTEAARALNSDSNCCIDTSAPAIHLSQPPSSLLASLSPCPSTNNPSSNPSTAYATLYAPSGLLEEVADVLDLLGLWRGRGRGREGGRGEGVRCFVDQSHTNSTLRRIRAARDARKCLHKAPCASTRLVRLLAALHSHRHRHSLPLCPPHPNPLPRAPAPHVPWFLCRGRCLHFLCSECVGVWVGRGGVRKECWRGRRQGQRRRRRREE